MKKHLIPVTLNKEPIEFANKQLEVFWLPDEINVEKDIMDILVNLTPAEKHGVIFSLKLFSLYETNLGSEFWGGRFKKIFPSADFHRMASVFSMFELAVHAPFYNKINQLLHLDNEEFYLSYLDDAVLRDRMKFIEDYIEHEDDAVALAVFSMVEGVILYSTFAYLKHFQSQGKNKITNICRGLDFSVRDENLHATGGAWSFRHLTRDYSEEQKQKIKEEVQRAATMLIEHEDLIIDKTFSLGEIKGITAHQCKSFTRSRVNECFKMLGFEKFYEVKYNPIAEGFYKSINDYTFNDFFSGQGKEYHRNWSEEGFNWNTTQKVNDELVNVLEEK
jgi:ribonucleotide reductase beta subunit family protein with ferritin-like domain